MTTTLGEEFVHQLNQDLGELLVQLERLALTNPNTTPTLSAQERRRWEHHFARLQRRVENRARLSDMIAAAYGGPESKKLRETLEKALGRIARLATRPPKDGLLSKQLLEFQAKMQQVTQLKQQLGVPKGGVITGHTPGAAGDPILALALGAALIVDLIGALFRSRHRR